MRKKMNKGWIGVDLDGTLARYDHWVSIYHIGEPVPLMINRVHEWVKNGIKVKIMTARYLEGETAIRIIQDWLEANGLPRLEVTNQKDFEMVELWDDRCIRVELNTGIIMVKEDYANERR